MNRPAPQPLGFGEREIGPIGTTARVMVGTVAVALPIALAGFSWIEAGIALVALPLIASVAAPLITPAYRHIHPTTLRSQHAACSPVTCTLIVVIVVANAAIVAPTAANGNVTIWVWLGASMLLAGARGYGGCEILALSNLVTGRRDQIGCMLYTPIDAAEAKRRLGAGGATRHSPRPGGAGQLGSR